ncbi:hypothetical protein PENTCL1PPCAC_25956, partial [Pristionchus entomophagus]
FFCLIRLVDVEEHADTQDWRDHVVFTEIDIDAIAFDQETQHCFCMSRSRLLHECSDERTALEHPTVRREEKY